MYPQKDYRDDNPEKWIPFIKANGFGILVNHFESEYLATHIPMEIQWKNGVGTLTGHVSRENEQWRLWSKASKGLAIFQGPHAFVSASWYDHPNVSTWNYSAVHVHGTIQKQSFEDLKAAAERLLDKYEASSENPVSFHKLDPSTLLKELKGIVGFTMTIEKIEGIEKLSQNRHDADHQSIIEHLQKRNDPQDLDLAKAMKNQRNKEK